MAYQTKDGKKRYENHEIGKAYDRSHMPVAKRNPLKPDGMPGEPIGSHEGAEPTEHEPGGEIEQVVAEHGPAHHTEIHAGGGHEAMGEMGGGPGAGMGAGHHVISHHASGHVHHSHGHSLESAHVHSHKAMGGSGEMHAEPDGDEGMGAEMMPASEGE